MDDTICDYKTAYKLAKEKNPEIEHPQSVAGFFLNLKPLPEAIEAVNLLRKDYDVYILTRPSYQNPLCYTEKRLWVEKYFDLEFCRKLIFCSDKTLIIGDILIDDVAWIGFKGRQIMFGKLGANDWQETLSAIERLQE